MLISDIIKGFAVNKLDSKEFFWTFALQQKSTTRDTIMNPESNQKSRRMYRYLVGMGILMSFLVCFLTGIIKIPDIYKLLGMTYKSPFMISMTQLHDWSGIILGVLAVLHIIVHRRWFIAMTKKYICGKQTMI